MSAAVEVRRLSKEFRVYHDHFGNLKERILHLGKRRYELFWALRDVDLEVASGETLAVIGANGQGKSTLLQIIAGIIRPTRGEVVTRGRLAILLEVGAGFHPDLTGRENIFMNGSILGLTRRQISKSFDDIVAFAELEQFIDNQIKHYSSGMYVRLGFSVAVHADPDILLVDEVLAVGDEAFQDKCLARIRRFQEEGRSIVFVTHELDLVSEVCDRAILLHHGQVAAHGQSNDVVARYRDIIAEHAT